MKDKLVRNLSRDIIFTVSILFIMLLIISGRSFRTTGTDKGLNIMFYNVENLFDTIDSPLEDSDFLPSSDRKWNTYKYFSKIKNLAKIIVASGRWDAPDLVGLCEVENEIVLRDLVSLTLLKREDYNTLYAESADRRGIGVALIYKDKLKLISSELFYPVFPNGDTIHTRSVLLATMGCGKDTLNIMVSHWPSRRGGASLTDPLRESVASLIREIIDNVSAGKVGNKFIIMGDFNCNPDSYILSEILLVNKQVNNELNTGSLISIQPANSRADIGTYKYQGRWNNFDQLLISSSLLQTESGLRYKASSLRVLDNDYILVEDKSYRGLKPKSTWSGPVYIGGYSDHLPIVFNLDLVE